MMATSRSGSSIGEAVSGRGANMMDDDDDDEGLYYIPERRHSLDVGPSSMDTTGHWFFVEPALTPAESYESMKSEDFNLTKNNNDSATRVQLNRADSSSSSFSFDSDDCEDKTPRVKTTEDSSKSTDEHAVMPDTNEFEHASVTVAFTFKTICDSLTKLPHEAFHIFKNKLWKFHSEIFVTSPHNMDPLDLVDRLLEHYGLQRSLQITKNLLVDMEQKEIVCNFQKLCLWNEIRHELCEILRTKYGEAPEGLSMDGEKRPLDEVYANLCIASCGNIGPNIEHEVMSIEKLHTHEREWRQLSLKDVYTLEGMDEAHTKFVLLTGVAGSGKTMAVQKLILEWIENQSHQNVTFLFPFTFRELQQFKTKEVSLLSIVQELYPPTERLTFEDLTSEDCTVMFIFDGLDEYNDDLDFLNTELYGLYSEPTSLDVIVVNLLRARLFYRGLFLVTSRSQVKHSIPFDTWYSEVQLQGFSHSEKDEYFRKRLKDPAQADRVISHMKSLGTLHIMCHLPLFCSLVGDECQRAFKEQGTQAQLPRRLTSLYTKMLLALIRRRRSVRVPERSADDERVFVMEVGKLAFTMLGQGKFRMSKSDDCKKFRVDEEELVDHSGICTQFVIKRDILYTDNVLSFIHPTVQEYMAALYVFLSLTNKGKNVFELQLKDRLKSGVKKPKAAEVYRSAVDASLQCEDGKLDIFLRFLFGMLVPTNQRLLGPLCTSSIKWPNAASDAAALIRKKLGDNHHPTRSCNLQHCLEELAGEA